MKNKKSYIMAASITCPLCNTTIFSRARHDFRFCTCKKYAVDGGFDYFKMCFPSNVEPAKVKKIRVYATRQELYYDWNHRHDKFGLIVR